MLKLVNRLSASLKNRATLRRSGIPMPAKPGTTGITWSAAEIQLLLNCEQAQRQWTVRMPGLKSACHTRLLGIDFTTNQLLLDSLCPALPAGFTATDEPFALRIALNSSEYQLNVRPREWLNGHQVVVDILSAGFALAAAPQQPPLRHVTFADLQAPKADLRLASGQTVRARLAALSLHGAEFVVGTADAAALRLSQTGVSCAMSFNDNFKLQCHGRTTQPPRQLKGQQHRFKLEFTHMDADYQLQLKAFLQACQTRTTAAA